MRKKARQIKDLRFDAARESSLPLGLAAGRKATHRSLFGLLTSFIYSHHEQIKLADAFAQNAM